MSNMAAESGSRTPEIEGSETEENAAPNSNDQQDEKENKHAPTSAELVQRVASLEQELARARDAIRIKDDKIEKLAKTNVDLTKVLNRCGAGGLKLREAMEDREKKITQLAKQLVTVQNKLKEKESRVGQLENQLRSVVENMAEYVGYLAACERDSSILGSTPRPPSAIGKVNPVTTH